MSTAEPGRSTSASASLSAATSSFADRDYQIVESRTLPIGRASVRPRRAPLRPSRRGKWPQDLLPVKGEICSKKCYLRAAANPDCRPNPEAGSRPEKLELD